MRNRVPCFMLFCWCVSAVYVSAGELPPSFTLGRYVPGDSCLYVHSVDNPERDWIKKEWGEFFNALRQSGVERDLTGLIFSMMAPQQREEIEASIQKAVSMMGKVKWGDLIAQELVIVHRFKPIPVGAEYAVLARGVPGSGENNIAALVAILNDVASLSENMSVVESTRNGIQTWRFTILNKKAVLFRQSDVIGLAVGQHMMNDIIDQMSGKLKKHSILVAPRFKNALTHVKTPSDDIVFVDMKRVLVGVNNRFHHAASLGSNDGETPDLSLAAAGKKLLILADVVDYIISSTSTKDRREATDRLWRFQEGKENSPLVKIFLDRKPFADFDRYIPSEASGFKVSGFIHLERFYDQTLDFISKNVPDGQNYMTKWNELLASVNFDPQRDIFSWWGGEMVSIDLPPAVANPMGGGTDRVWLIRVKDTELAKNKINTFINFVNTRMQSEGQMLMVSPAPVQVEGFRTITHPVMAMFLQPVIGVHKEWLIISTSPNAVNQCLDVASGKSPSIRKNPRFKNEGLIPDGPVMSVSFKDTSTFGDELAQGIGMVGMLGGMFGGLAMSGITDDESGEAKKVFQKLMGSLMKLGPVLQKLDFYSSKSSVVTYDGKLDLRTTSVVSYKTATSESSKSAEVKHIRP